MNGLPLNTPPLPSQPEQPTSTDPTWFESLQPDLKDTLGRIRDDMEGMRRFLKDLEAIKDETIKTK